MCTYYPDQQPLIQFEFYIIPMIFLPMASKVILFFHILYIPHTIHAHPGRYYSPISTVNNHVTSNSLNIKNMIINFNTLVYKYLIFRSPLFFHVFIMGHFLTQQTIMSIQLQAATLQQSDTIRPKPKSSANFIQVE